MSTDFRTICAELVELDRAEPGEYAEWRQLWTATIKRARAALAEPELVGPTDEELLELMPQQFRDDLATVSRLAAHGTSPDVTPGVFRVTLNTGALNYARAVLARWPRPAPVVPVAVSERLPGSKDCDENGRVWAWRPFDPEDDEIGDLWELILSRWLNKSYWTHWLPAHAIPLPQAGELESHD